MIIKFFGLVGLVIVLSCGTHANAQQIECAGYRNGIPYGCRAAHRPPVYRAPAHYRAHQYGGRYQRSRRVVHRETVVRTRRGMVTDHRPTNPRRAQQQAMCDEQAAKRRALGVVDSRVVWESPYTCRATGGFVERGRL